MLVFPLAHLQGHLIPLNRCPWQVIKKNPSAENINQALELEIIILKFGIVSA